MSERFPDGTTYVRRDLHVNDFESVCNLTGKEISTFITAANGEEICLILWGVDDIILGATRSETASLPNEIFEQLKSSLNLTELEPRAGGFGWLSENLDEGLRSSVEGILTRLGALEEAVFARSRRLRAFLAYRFTPVSERLLPPLEKFLGLLDVEVITGANYEPRRVSDKVIERLRGPIDMIVFLLTHDGESLWTRDEIAVGHFQEIPIIPLVEEGSTFTQGLLGDLEYITFAPGHIGDAFLRLLEAIKYVREKKPTAAMSDPNRPTQDSSR